MLHIPHILCPLCNNNNNNNNNNNKLFPWGFFLLFYFVFCFCEGVVFVLYAGFTVGHGAVKRAYKNTLLLLLLLLLLLRE
jgi:hypothetical protein